MEALAEATKVMAALEAQGALAEACKTMEAQAETCKAMEALEALATLEAQVQGANHLSEERSKRSKRSANIRLLRRLKRDIPNVVEQGLQYRQNRRLPLPARNNRHVDAEK